MSRLPPLSRDDLSSEGQQLHDRIEQITSKSFGRNGELLRYEDGRVAYIGPFPFYLAEPNSGHALLNYITALGPLPLPADARETAILAVGGHYQAGYELYAHTNIAISKGLLSKQQCETIKQDMKPSGLNENCSVAYDVAKYLSSQKGPLPQDLWDAAVKAFARDGTVALMHYVAYYVYTCVALNFMDAPVPI